MAHPSKHYYIIGTNLMQGINYGTIMICMDKTKTLGDMKRKIVEFLNEHHGVSISENNFQLYRSNKLPINPGSFSWKNWEQRLDSRLCNITRGGKLHWIYMGRPEITLHSITYKRCYGNKEAQWRFGSFYIEWCKSN